MAQHLLASVPCFSRLTPNELAELQAFCKLRSVPAHQIVAQRRHPVRELVIVLEGSIAVRAPGSVHCETTLAIMGPGHCLGVGPLLGDGLWPYTIQALTDAEFWVVSRDDLSRLLMARPDAADRIRLTLPSPISSRPKPVRPRLLVSVCGLLLLTAWGLMRVLPGKAPLIVLGLVLLHALLVYCAIRHQCRQQGQRDHARAVMAHEANRRIDSELEFLHRRIAHLEQLARGHRPASGRLRSLLSPDE